MVLIFKVLVIIISLVVVDLEMVLVEVKAILVLEILLLTELKNYLKKFLVRILEEDFLINQIINRVIKINNKEDKIHLVVWDINRVIKINNKEDKIHLVVWE